VPWTCNAQGSPTYVGEGIQKLTGFTAQELIDGGATFWRTRVHDEDLEAVNTGLASLFGSGVPLDVEYRFQRKDGEWAWVYARASSVSQEDGVSYTQGLISDISLRKAAEENNARLTMALEGSNRELECRNREVQRATMLKSRFLANMSHELRTPLNAILGFSELLEDPANGEMTARQHRWIGHIRTGSKHLLQLINDILDISKIEADQLEFRPEAFVLRDAIVESLAILRPLAQARRVNLAENVPSDLVVEVDRTRLKQIIYNLASNAVKFTPAHGLVRIEAMALSDAVRVNVRDTGVGINPQDREAIFEEFRQVSETNKGVPEGTGLGLAITKRLVERQGGRIWLESEVGKGSLFSFTLRKGTRAPARPSPPDKRDHEKFSILIVDNEPTTRELLLSYLDAEGFETFCANSAAQGRELAGSGKPDAIILDVLLPDAEGWDLLQALKLDPVTAQIPVIVVSIIDRKEKGFTLGASDYLTKPVSREALLQSVKQHLPAHPGAQILVVEDQPADREIICETLSPLGYRLRTSDNGEDGLEVLRNDDGRLRLIIMDLTLPRMNGFELLRRMKEIDRIRHLPVVVLTGKDLTLAESDFLRTQSQAVFLKGEEWRRDFIRQVHETLERKQQPMQVTS
jgi:PAS domain S-box-containing protein